MVAAALVCLNRPRGGSSSRWAMVGQSELSTVGKARQMDDEAGACEGVQKPNPRASSEGTAGGGARGTSTRETEGKAKPKRQGRLNLNSNSKLKERSHLDTREILMINNIMIHVVGAEDTASGSAQSLQFFTKS